MSAAKAKGTAWETALVRSLGAFWNGRYGLAPRRVAQQGHDDLGDLHGISPFVGQAKNYRDIVTALREGLEGAEVQHKRAREDYGVAFVKRPRKSVGQGYAVMTVETWARLLIRLRRAETLIADHVPPADQVNYCRAYLDDLKTPFPRPTP